ncbi:MAG: hypothetical protein QMC78_04635 [Methanocellales archaeon]|nr:hypothetical protein [Methanocellales archaeon]
MKKEKRDIVVDGKPFKAIELKNGRSKLKPKNPIAVSLSAHSIGGRVNHIDQEHYDPIAKRWVDNGDIKPRVTVRITTQAETPQALPVPPEVHDYAVGYGGVPPRTITTEVSGGTMSILTSTAGTISVGFF